MGLWKSLGGIVSVEINSATSADMLTAINNSGIELYDVASVNELTVFCRVRWKDYQNLKALLDRRGEEMTIVEKYGLYWNIHYLRSRPILILGMSLLLLLNLYLPTRVLFVKVEGNSNVPTQRIVNEAANIGISFGASRRHVRSEKAKNALLSVIPELQWVGVNTRGCVAVISVQERTKHSENNVQLVGSIVASCDGVIQKMTVTRGNPLYTVGQAVCKNQILVSGYTDCGNVVKATRAEAEVFAQTLRDIHVIIPNIHQQRIVTEQKKTFYCLRIGKKLIKLYKDSGISDTRCVKMYSEEYLTLPGGFQLPVALITEYSSDYLLLEEVTEPPDWLDASVEEYLQSCMIAGKILQKNSVITNEESLSVLNGRYTCLEMIGQKRYEETLIQNGT